MRKEKELASLLNDYNETRPLNDAIPNEPK
jgi:hypothetical protein